MKSVPRNASSGGFFTRSRGARLVLPALGCALLLIASQTASAVGRVSVSRSPRAARFSHLNINPNTNFVPASIARRGRVQVIVQLDGAPVARHQVRAERRGRNLSGAEQASIRRQISSNQDGVASRIRALGGDVLNRYQDVYNGMAVRVAGSDLRAVSRLPGVAAIRPVHTYQLSNTKGVPYIRGPQAWTGANGVTGRGVQVAVLDTGIDYYHANFGGSGRVSDFNSDNGLSRGTTFPTAKVVEGRDFVGDRFDAASDNAARRVPNPDPDPLDCEGHGSHVAGSAVGFGVLANGRTFRGTLSPRIYQTKNFRIGPGVAPRAQLLAYRVFGCTGSTDDATIVAALNRARLDGADVVNMSLGSPFGGPEDAATQASNLLAQAGVTVVAASGNEGPNAYMTGSPASATRAISVAALDAFGPTFPGGRISGPRLDGNRQAAGRQAVKAINANGSRLPARGSLKVLRNPDGSVALGCARSDYRGSRGRIVVTQRGVCPRIDRARFGDAAGADGVIMINDSTGFPPFEGKIPGVNIPFLGVQQRMARAFRAAAGTSASVRARPLRNTGFRKLTDFSSAGPRSVDSGVKPDVSAPGLSIKSTASGTGAGASTVSGTSMASPMTAGAAALVKNAHPDWDAAQVKAALINTANAGAKIRGYNTRAAGAGVVDAARAASTVGLATTSDGADALNFGYQPAAAAISETRTFTLENTGTTPVTYELTHAFNGGSRGANLGLNQTSVTVPANGSRNVNVTLSMGAAALRRMSSVSTLVVGQGRVRTVRGAVVATPSTTGAGMFPLRVPFLMVPRALSDVNAGPPDPLNANGVTRVQLTNDGLDRGTADLYAWGIEDVQGDVPADAPIDVRAAGVQTLPRSVLCGNPPAAGCGTANDRSLLFAINTHGRWSNASSGEFDIPIDTGGTRRAEFFVIGVDLGLVLTGVPSGVLASFIVRRSGQIVNAWLADAPMDGSTLLLPTLASDIGLRPASGRFAYRVDAFSLLEPDPGQTAPDEDTTGRAVFNAHRPALSTGAFVPLAPGVAPTTLRLAVDRTRLARTPALGWMIVTMDDENGAAQAELVSIPGQ